MSKMIGGLVASVVVALVTGTAVAGGAEPAKLLGPAKGVSFDVGAKRVVGYYQPRDGVCDLTVMVADQLTEHDHLPAPGSRVNVSVVPGAAARIDTPDGKSIAFVCAVGATAMTVKPLARTAYARRT